MLKLSDGVFNSRLTFVCISLALIDITINEVLPGQITPPSLSLSLLEEVIRRLSGVLGGLQLDKEGFCSIQFTRNDLCSCSFISIVSVEEQNIRPAMKSSFPQPQKVTVFSLQRKIT